MTTTPIFRAAVFAAAAATLGAIGSTAQAQVTRGFIGPHEYSLPDPKGMKPWNVFVEYSTLQKNSDAWNSRRDKVDGGDAEVLVSLSKFVRFWEVSPGVGIAMELIVPKVGIRDTAGKGAGDASGIADLIVGPAFWIKPAPNWTLGSDFVFVQIPVGDPDVGGGKRWNAIASVFWDGQFDKLNWTANVGATFHGKSSNGFQEGIQVYFNNRFGYRASELVEPFLGLDYERQQAKDNPGNNETALSFGLMFNALDKGHVTLHYSKGINGENRAVSNNLNLRFAYVF